MPSQNQTAILENGQQKEVQTAAGDPTEKLESVSREEDKDCGREEDVSTCEVLNTHPDIYTQIRHTFCRVKVEINTNVLRHLLFLHYQGLMLGMTISH